MAIARSLNGTALSNALVLIALPLVLPIILKLAPVKTALAPTLLPILGKPWGNLPGWIVGPCWGFALWQAWLAFKPLMTARPKSTVPVSQAGESSIANTLAPLESQGWTIDYRVPGFEDVIWASSPKGNGYAIVIRHHKGKIGAQGERLCRIYDQTKRPFEDDFLAVAQRRSKSVGQIKGRVALPVLVFPEALLEGLRDPIAGVQVVNIQSLRKTLLHRG
jgi:hypothetical protein